MPPRALLSLTFLAATVPGLTSAAEKDTRLFELRTQYSAPGKLDDLHARHRDWSLKVFARHGLTNIGYWVPVENPDDKLISLRACRNREERDRSLAAIKADPAFQQIRKQLGRFSEKGTEVVLLRATEYSPPVRPTRKSERAFALCTVNVIPGKLDALHARFRDHDLRLFEKHGLTPIGVWVPIRKEKGEGTTLIFIVAQQDVPALKASLEAVHADPAWEAARKDAEEKASGPLTVKDGVRTVFLKPTDYSPLQ